MKFLVNLYENLCKTYNIRKYGEFFTQRPTVFFFWHSNFFVLPYAFKNSPVYILISPSRDGEIITRFVGYFGLGVIRSSHRKNKYYGLKEIIRSVEEGKNICITPDGPLGPRGRFKRGTVSLIKRLNVRTVFVGVAYSHFWELDTWDRFKIPMPFASVVIYAFEGYPNSEMEAEEMLNHADELAGSLL